MPPQQQEHQEAPQQPSTALERSQQARQLWLAATTLEELDQVETLLKSALNATSSHHRTTTSKNHHHQNNNSNKRQKYAELSPSEYRKAGERLSLLYCQSGRTTQAMKGLEYLGFQCRLARQVLDYPIPSSTDTSTFSKKQLKANTDAPCIILDNFLHPHELQHLQRVFQDPSASYWTDHSYQVEPPSPYFSYVLNLQKRPHQHGGGGGGGGFIAQLAQQIRQLPQLQAKFPQLAQTQYVELWAHNRPHASGHQLHFDSDDEGRGGQIRNPVCSTILYLTTPDSTTTTTPSAAAAGGPSLVTNQRLTSQHLATKGWLAHPKPRRLVVFDGGVLHGVIPGKGVHPGRRVTLMMAFWKHIEIRNGSTPGSARPFPSPIPTTSTTANSKTLSHKPIKHQKPVQEQQRIQKQWVIDLTTNESSTNVAPKRPTSLKEAPPISLSTVYETLKGDPWKAHMGMPEYEQVFQGF